MNGTPTFRPVVKLLVAQDETPNELVRTMQIHPLAY